MPSAIVYGYYYRFKAARTTIKDLVTIDNLEEATTKLDIYISEHDNYISNVNLGNSVFTDTDNKSLHHAKRHLNAFNITGQLYQKNKTIRALDET
jgi:hypothetical protein